MKALLSALALAVIAGAGSTAIAPVSGAEAATRYGCFKIINGTRYHFCGYKERRRQLWPPTYPPQAEPGPDIPTSFRSDRGEGGGGRGRN